MLKTYIISALLALSLMACASGSNSNSSGQKHIKCEHPKTCNANHHHHNPRHHHSGRYKGDSGQNSTE